MGGASSVKGLGTDTSALFQDLSHKAAVPAGHVGDDSYLVH